MWCTSLQPNGVDLCVKLAVELLRECLVSLLKRKKKQGIFGTHWFLVWVANLEVVVS